MPTSSPVTTSGSSSSRRLAPACSVHLRQERHRGRTRLRPGTVPDRLRHPGRPRRAARVAASRSARCSTRSGVYAGTDEPYLFGRPGSAVRIPSVAATARSPRSATRTATAGCSRRSPRDCPGRVDANATTFTSSAELAGALRRAAAAHGEHEKRTGGQRDADWPDWYAEYIVAEQAGKELPT